MLSILWEQRLERYKREGPMRKLSSEYWGAHCKDEMESTPLAKDSPALRNHAPWPHTRPQLPATSRNLEAFPAGPWERWTCFGATGFQTLCWPLSIQEGRKGTAYSCPPGACSPWCRLLAHDGGCFSAPFTGDWSSAPSYFLVRTAPLVEPPDCAGAAAGTCQLTKNKGIPELNCAESLSEPRGQYSQCMKSCCQIRRFRSHLGPANQRHIVLGLLELVRSCDQWQPMSCEQKLRLAFWTKL
ncbi:uncharacterized protein LOC121498826 isoform X2 [Vulpes lagopus]|uniref:uncharacterized protein LOC121498826 isoform X2 n=1 Tax=Vulpes lagopus TaxID=494514 RepID=UPI001BC9EB8E|nr:uncharacterized protein LOC121498826 isoform X2 [Vulpes lagopus]